MAATLEPVDLSEERAPQGVSFEYGCEYSTFLSDGRLVTADSRLTVWDLERGCRLSALRLPEGRGAYWAVEGSPTAGVVAVVYGTTKDVLLVDVDSGEIRQTLPHSDRTQAIAWSADGTWVATGGGQLYGDKPDTTVRVWDAETGELLWQLKGLKKPIASLDFSSDGTHLAAGAGNTARVWQLVVDGKPRKRPPAPKKVPAKDPVGQVRIIPSSLDVLVAAGCSIVRFDLERGEARWTRSWQRIQTHACQSLAWTRAGVLAHVVDDVVLLDPETGEVRWTNKGPRGIKHLLAAPDGEHFIAVGGLVSSIERRRLRDGLPADVPSASR